MNIYRSYIVAEHLFSVGMDADALLWGRMREPYGPFEVGVSPESGPQAGREEIFRLEVCDGVTVGGDAVMTYSNRGTVEPGFIILDVYRSGTGYWFEFTQPSSEELNGRLYISSDFRTALLSLYGPEILQWLTFTAAVDFCFLLATSCRGTLLTHSSAVVFEGRAYLFLGKSGTGKSTHSRMWLRALPGTVLMNDDHPIIRLAEDGTVRAYGSPWSGKTSCYRNMSAPLGGIIRISRAGHNRARRLSPIESYASLMTSCSGMTWERELADGKDRTMQGVISVTPCWVMECLPDEDAARVCSEAVAGIYREGL